MKIITLEEMSKKKAEQDRLDILGVRCFAPPVKLWMKKHTKFRMRIDIKKRTILYATEHKKG